MKKDIVVGDQVKLISVPAWLIHDLPDGERNEILACVGLTAFVQKIDAHGHFWIGFGQMSEAGDSAHFSGHSFAVPLESIIPVE